MANVDGIYYCTAVGHKRGSRRLATSSDRSRSSLVLGVRYCNACYIRNFRPSAAVSSKQSSSTKLTGEHAVARPNAGMASPLFIFGFPDFVLWWMTVRQQRTAVSFSSTVCAPSTLQSPAEQLRRLHERDNPTTLSTAFSPEPSIKSEESPSILIDEGSSAPVLDFSVNAAPLHHLHPHRPQLSSRVHHLVMISQAMGLPLHCRSNHADYFLSHTLPLRRHPHPSCFLPT